MKSKIGIAVVNVSGGMKKKKREGYPLLFGVDIIQKLFAHVILIWKLVQVGFQRGDGKNETH